MLLNKMDLFSQGNPYREADSSRGVNPTFLKGDEAMHHIIYYSPHVRPLGGPAGNILPVILRW